MKNGDVIIQKNTGCHLALEGEGGPQCRVRGKDNKVNSLDTPSSVLRTSSPSWERGFTLIELLVVVLIIGVLAAIAVPQYQKAVKKSTYAGMFPVLATIVEAQKLHYMAHGEYAQNMTQLDIDLPITETCVANDLRIRAIDVGYRVGEYCVFFTNTIHTSGADSIGVLIGLATEKFGLVGYKAKISGYEYLFTSNSLLNRRPANELYCRAQAGIGTDSHCTGELITDNNYGAWFKMN